MKSRLTALLVASLLSACASLPPPAMPARQQVGDFALEARFALRMTPPDQAAQSAGGRLSWSHTPQGDRILISSPLGYGLAEIETTPTLSRLLTADGKHLESNDPEGMLEEATGQRLPVTQLPAWLLGRANGSARIEQDAQARPARLTEAGWQIDYAYDDENPGALPVRLTVSRAGEIELRLRIEVWKEMP